MDLMLVCKITFASAEEVESKDNMKWCEWL